MGVDSTKAPQKLHVLQSGSFAYVLGHGSTTGGYAQALLPRHQAIGTELHSQVVRTVLNRRPGGFLRLTKKPSLRVFYRALHTLFAKNSLGRILNFGKYLYQRSRKSRVTYLPPLVFVDPSSACNLRCPGCATGLNLTRKRSMASLEMMRSVVDQVSKTALQISFYHLGEAFFNDDVFDAVQHAKSKGLWTLVSSHLSLDRPRLAERIVESGLHDLLISCDGASQAVYEQYRRGGNLELVLSNVRGIRAHRDKLHLKTPFIRMKMIVFEHNWHEVPSFTALARAAGADEVQFVSGNGAEALTGGGAVAGGSQFDIADLSWKEKVPQGACADVWLSMYITPDGGAFSCCLGHKEEDLFVAPGPPDVRQMWNSEGHVASREYFLGLRPAEALPGICRSCSYVNNFAQHRGEATSSSRDVP